MSGEFDGAPLVASTVRGVRRFRVDELGRLRSPQQGTVWRPGDNTAECRRGQQAPTQQVTIGITTYTVNMGGFYSGQPVTAKVETDPSHSLASCRCGYYAYSGGGDAAEYGGDGTVAAVVEGWGDVMVGTRGFRAQHARVLAVTISDRASGPSRPRPLKRAEDVRWWRPYGVGWAWLAVAVLTAFSAGVRFAHGDAWEWEFVVAALLDVFFAFVSQTKERERREAARRYRSHAIKDFAPPAGAVVAAFRANYPDVAVYSSYEAMVADFPPDPGDRPTPAMDPGFWDRP